MSSTGPSTEPVRQSSLRDVGRWLREAGIEPSAVLVPVSRSLEGNGQPYHCAAHCLLVGFHARNLAVATGMDHPEHFLLAGLFHDAGHRYGSDRDDENIALALRVWASAVEQAPGTSGEIMAGMDVQVRDLIGATRFPWTRDDLAARVMTDADIFESAVDQNWCDLLTAETGQPASREWALERLRTPQAREAAAERTRA